MLDEICAYNIATIREAQIFPSRGMTAITGETGAGKTALLTSCRLLMGERAKTDVISHGADHASVEGRFFVDDDVWRSHVANHLDDEEDDEPVPSGSTADSQQSGPFAVNEAHELVVKRRITSDGRSRIKANGSIAGVSELAEVVSPLISLCSQHDQVLISKPSAQRAFLDDWCASVDGSLLEEYRNAYRTAKRARARMEELRKRAAIGERELEDARTLLRRLDAFDPSEEDYSELKRSLAVAENAEALARLTNEASDALTGDQGALDQLQAAVALLEDAAKVDDSLMAFANAIREGIYIAEDAARDVSSYASAMDVDMSELPQMQERMAEYQSLLRLHGPSMQDLLAAHEDARATVLSSEDSDEIQEEAARELEVAEDALKAAANALYELHAREASTLAGEVNGTLSRLMMSGSSFECSVKMESQEAWSASGPDRVTFLFSPTESMTARPLSKIASGGELSRVMLALHAALGEKDNVSTLVFDEVDAGVGGNAADALGEVMHDLSQTHQVIIVTHLAQVASKATQHYVARKTDVDGVAQTSIEEVSGESRVAEIARMLSGKITEISLAHAQELLGSADSR